MFAGRKLLVFASLGLIASSLAQAQPVSSGLPEASSGSATKFVRSTDTHGPDGAGGALGGWHRRRGLQIAGRRGRRRSHYPEMMAM